MILITLTTTFDMDKNRIIQLRGQLKEFFKSDKRIFVFKVDSELPDRVKFIYQVVFPGILKFKFFLVYLIARLAQYIDYSPIKIFLYRLIGIKIGKGVFIAQDVILDPHFPCLITIEDYCIIGWGAKLFTHEFSNNEYRVGRIDIQEGATIGAFSTLRGGVTVGKMADIPYGTILYRNVPAYSKPMQILFKKLDENA